MKKFVSLGLVLLLMVGVLSGCGGTKEKAASTAATTNTTPIKLKVADGFPTTHPISLGINVWMKRVTELTDGQVTFDYFPAEQLGKIKDILKAVQGKVADVGFAAPSYATSIMPLSSVMEIPGAIPSSVAGVTAFWKLSQTTLLKPDYLANGVVPIFVYALPPYEIWTTAKQVQKPEDLKGLKLRSTGGANDQAIKDLGGTPVTQAVTEMYESLDKKVTDGSILSSSSVKPYKIEELLKYATQGAALGSFVGTYCVNQEVWDGLPKNVQEAMIKAGEEASLSTAAKLDKSNADVYEEFKTGGMKIYTFTADDKKVWASKMSDVEAEWVKKLGNKASLGTQLIQERNKLTQEAAK